MDRSISLQAAIDAIDDIGSVDTYADRVYAKGIMRMLPSAQPEIVRCEECSKCQIDEIFHDYWCNGMKVTADHYRGYAERRTDG